MTRRVTLIGAALVLGLAVAGCSRGSGPPIIGGDPLEQALELGDSVYTTQCAVCHVSGEETDLAPGLRDVTMTFPDCEDQNEFVRVGSDAWPSGSYGATNQPIGGYDLVMPAYEFVLDDDEIAAVNLWIRVEFGNEPVAASADSCGVPAR